MKIDRFRIDEIPGCSIDCSLNKECKGDVKEIRIVAVMDNELELGKHLNVTKRVQYQSGIKIDMNHSICPLPYDFDLQVMNCINNVKKAVKQEYRDIWIDDTPIQVVICIETLDATYEHTACEQHLDTFYPWILRVYEDIYGVGYKIHFEDFAWFTE